MGEYPATEYTSQVGVPTVADLYAAALARLPLAELDEHVQHMDAEAKRMAIEGRRGGVLAGMVLICGLTDTLRRRHARKHGSQ